MIMMRFEKLFYSNILVYAIVSAIVFPSICYSHPDALRVPIGNHDRLREIADVKLLLDQVVSVNSLWGLYINYTYSHTYYMQVVWPEAFQKRYEKLKETSKGLGDKCVMHNTKKEKSDGILEKGIKPDKLSRICFMIYDFKKRSSINNGLAYTVWNLMGKGEEKDIVGNGLDLNNIAGIISDENQFNIRRYLSAIQRDIDYEGYYWYGDSPNWYSNAIAKFAVDLSIDEKKLDNVIEDLLKLYSDEIANKRIPMQMLRDRLKQIAIVYIWMGRLIDGIAENAAFPLPRLLYDKENVEASI